jgi:hypothetical protein
LVMSVHLPCSNILTTFIMDLSILAESFGVNSLWFCSDFALASLIILFFWYILNIQSHE